MAIDLIATGSSDSGVALGVCLPSWLSALAGNTPTGSNVGSGAGARSDSGFVRLPTPAPRNRGLRCRVAVARL
jgi:hypothetical protein